MKWKVGDYLYDLGVYRIEYKGDVGVIEKIENDKVVVSWFIAEGKRVCKEKFNGFKTLEEMHEMDSKFIKMKEKEIVLTLL